VVALVALGFCLGLLWLAVAYLSATPASERQSPDCSDCYVYLGRWWEPGFALLIIGLNFIAWTIGVLAGWGIRATARRSISRGDGASRAT
jgi:hypothetical protein